MVFWTHLVHYRCHTLSVDPKNSHRHLKDGTCPLCAVVSVVHQCVLRYGSLPSLNFPLVVFGINDVYDYPSDLRNPRKQSPVALEGGVLPPAYHSFVLMSARLASLFILIVAAIFALSIPPQEASPSWISPECFQFMAVTTLIVGLGWAYSTPPFRLKERPVLDSLSNGYVVWLCWALGYTSTGLPLPILSTILPSGLPSDGLDENAHKGWLLAFCTSGVHALGAVADVGADAAAGQKTIATAFGERGASAFAVLL